MSNPALHGQLAKRKALEYDREIATWEHGRLAKEARDAARSHVRSVAPQAPRWSPSRQLVEARRETVRGLATVKARRVLA